MTETDAVAIHEKDETFDLAAFAAGLRKGAARCAAGLADRPRPEGERGRYDLVLEEIMRQLEAAFQRVVDTPLPPPGPWAFRGGEKSASVRRRIERLRAGLAEPGQPADPAALARQADTMEKQLEYRDFARSFVRDLYAAEELLSGSLLFALNAVARTSPTLFSELKARPGMRDPESLLSHEIERIHRARRATAIGPARTDEGKRRQWPRRKR